MFRCDVVIIEEPVLLQTRYQQTLLSFRTEPVLFTSTSQIFVFKQTVDQLRQRVRSGFLDNLRFLFSLETILNMLGEVGSGNVHIAHRTVGSTRLSIGVFGTSWCWFQHGPRTQGLVRTDILLLLYQGPLITTITTESLQESRQEPHQILSSFILAQTLLVKLCVTARTFLLELEVFSHTNRAEHMETGGAGGVRHHLVADWTDQNILQLLHLRNCL